MTWQRDVAQVQSLMLKVDENEAGAEELLLLLLFASTVGTNLGQLLSVSFAFFLALLLSFCHDLLLLLLTPPPPVLHAWRLIHKKPSIKYRRLSGPTPA